MARNEKTGSIAATLAGRMSRTLAGMQDAAVVWVHHDGLPEELGTVKELQTVIASALTQAPDKKQ